MVINMSYFGAEQLELVFRVTMVVVPVALYFFILGFLNTRLHPQVLSGRQDFAILTVALSPLVFGPFVHYFGDNLLVLVVGVSLLGLAGFVLTPCGRSLVIYNMTLSGARRVVAGVLKRQGMSVKVSGRGVGIHDNEAFVEISGFPFLRVITIRMADGNEEFWNDFQTMLINRVQRIEVVPRPIAVSLLLVATCMLVAPMILVVQHTPEIVRLLEDLVK